MEIALPVMTDARGRMHRPCMRNIVTVEGAGSTIVVRIDGDYPTGGGLWLKSRWQFDAARGVLEAAITLHNPRAARLWGRTCWSALEDGPTGLATLGGIGRGAGNSINALVDTWLLSGDGAWLEVAERLVRRCIHPQTDWDALGLLQAEKKWSYTMFVTSLVKFVQARQAAGLVDAAYAYAYDSLRSLGLWMSEREQPYFAQREALEFPTETWPAQDLRKANLLRLAAASAEGPQRDRVLARGDALADRAWSDLLACPKPTTTRAMAIVTVEGLRDAELRAMRPPPFPRPPQVPLCGGWPNGWRSCWQRG